MAIPAAAPSEHTQHLKDYSDTVYVFRPGNQSRPTLSEYIAQIWGLRHFIKAMAKSDIQGSNSNTLLGQVWSLLDPLFQAAIYWMLITLVRGGSSGQTVNGMSPAQRATLIIGLFFLFTQFKVAFGDASRELMKKKGLILNSRFPTMIFPISSMWGGLIEFIPAVFVYIVSAVLSGMPFSTGMALLPLLFVFQLMMGLGIALLTTTAMVFVRDMSNLLGYVMRILLFLTPIIYPVSALQSVGPVIRTVIWLNPLFPLFAAYQAILTGGMPTAGQIFATIAWAVAYLVAGYQVFTRNEQGFAIRL